MLPNRTELVDGEIVEMPAQYDPAVTVIQRMNYAFFNAWRSVDLVRAGLTHAFASGWNPMPDLALYDERPPRRPKDGPYPEPRLVIEVSDETLDYDLGEKARHYAAENVVEYWVADVNGRILHVFREPAGEHFRLHRKYLPGDAVSPLCLPNDSFAVAELLPQVYGQP